ncbi:MAG: response regulator transcription factor [Polaromonas sp.]|uniref:response regulator transcription factor n=1 Tax=Hydrogenophaga sp. TaxID=1904254 RepID=UPI00272F2E02|nr:response regulator transcription factor [Hydrogenophaga sp.]MDP1686545.1 response regulator transcription factor [Hydrogenophaga sp.]MDP1954654.1 response regulator transcription factor [Polaromonas sp.]MDP3751789.1 response regulator transcription factor [Polaromonas sp.]
MALWRVLIVEDDVPTRDFFADSVSRSHELHLVAGVGTFEEARVLIEDASRSIDILLTDLALPDGNGLDLIRLAGRVQPACEALVISMFGDEDSVLSSVEAGALGYIHKDFTPDNIALTILEMKAGASPISPMIARRVLAKYHAMHLVERDAAPASGASSRPPPPAAGGRALLSAREQEVLELIARGFSYGEISRLKAVSVHTIQSHIKNLYAKLAVHSRSEAVYEATRMGLLQPPTSEL